MINSLFILIQLFKKSCKNDKNTKRWEKILRVHKTKKLFFIIVIKEIYLKTEKLNSFYVIF